VYPFDSARIILMCDAKNNGQHHFKGIIDIFKQVLRKRGIEGLYQGFMISVLGILVYRAAYFGLYDFFRKFVDRQKVLLSFLLGFSVTLLAGLISYPLDTIRTRMILSCVFGTPYRTSFHAIRDIVMKEGFGSLWRGVGIRVLYSTFTSIILVLYDALTKK